MKLIHFLISLNLCLCSCSVIYKDRAQIEEIAEDIFEDVLEEYK